MVVSSAMQGFVSFELLLEVMKLLAKNCEACACLQEEAISHLNAAQQTGLRMMTGYGIVLSLNAGYLHMGFHHEPTEEDMERLEVWFNKHVLHAHGVMHKTAHFDWSTFNNMHSRVISCMGGYAPVMDSNFVARYGISPDVTFSCLRCVHRNEFRLRLELAYVCNHRDNMCMSSGDEACNREFSDSNFKLNTAAISAEAEVRCDININCAALLPSQIASFKGCAAALFDYHHANILQPDTN
eukprot:scaffold24317_cov18-Tisochrysis_lutea.AAC.2